MDFYNPQHILSSIIKLKIIYNERICSNTLPDSLQHKIPGENPLEQDRTTLHKYIWGILKEKNCHLYRVNSVEDHLHIMTSLNQSIALKDLVKDIKLGCSDFIKRDKIFPGFGGWQEKYAAFTYSIKEKNNLIEYVKNQKEHHRIKTFREELIELLTEHEIPFEEKYLD